MLRRIDRILDEIADYTLDILDACDELLDEVVDDIYKPRQVECLETACKRRFSH